MPPALVSETLVLEALQPRHNHADHAAWTSSVDHIRSTPGFSGRDWPAQPLTLDENEADLVRHAQDFAERTGFAYTVLDPASSDVIGCVYLYPPRCEGYDVDVRSWVRADRAELDKPLHDLVRRWLADEWPFVVPEYARR